MELRKKLGRIRKPNWSAAFCGVLYLLFFFVLPVYNFQECLLPGWRLITASVLAWVLLLCGVAMMIFPLFLKRKVCLWGGLVCLVIVGLFGLLGNAVLYGKNTLAALSLDLHYEGFRAHHTAVGLGYFLCLGSCLFFCMLEWHADWLHPKKHRFRDKEGNQIYRDRNGNEMIMENRDLPL